MASTLQARMEAYVGAITDTSPLSNWLNGAVNKLLQLLPPERAERVATVATVPDDGYAIGEGRVLRCVRDGYPSTQRPPDLQGRLTDANSLWYARADDPAHIVVNGTLHLYPTGGAVRKVYFLPLSTTVAPADTRILSLPTDWEQAVVLDACIQLLASRLETEIDAMPAALSNLTVTYVPPTVTNMAGTYSIDLTSDIVLLKQYVETDEDMEKAEAEAQAIQVKLAEWEKETTFAFQKERANADAANDLAKANALAAAQVEIQKHNANSQNAISAVQRVVALVKATQAQMQTLLLEYQRVLQPFMLPQGAKDEAGTNA